MIDLNPAYGGPYVHKTERANPTEVIISLIDEMPAASRETLRKEFRSRVSDDPDYLNPIIDYYFTNAMFGIERSKTKRPAPRSKGLDREEKEAEGRKLAEKIKAALILDFMCPNGKKVRENRGTYVARLGGGLARIGRAAGQKIVGKALSDAKAQKLYAG